MPKRTPQKLLRCMCLVLVDFFGLSCWVGLLPILHLTRQWSLHSKQNSQFLNPPSFKTELELVAGKVAMYHSGVYQIGTWHLHGGPIEQHQISASTPVCTADLTIGFPISKRKLLHVTLSRGHNSGSLSSRTITSVKSPTKSFSVGFTKSCTFAWGSKYLECWVLELMHATSALISQVMLSKNVIKV